MSLSRSISLALAGALAVTAAAQAAPFTPGSVVVYRVGDGAATLLNTGAAVFLDEYSPTGTLLQSVPLPVATSGGNRALIASGTASSEGLITRSADGQCLFAPGYGRDLAGGVGSLSATTAATVPRVMGIIRADGTVNTATALGDAADANNPRSVTGGSCTGPLWMTGGAGGIRTFAPAATTSTQISTTLTNLRQVSIFDGQLYVSTSSGSAVRVGTVGSGLPVDAGQTITNLPSFPVVGSPYAFVLADLSVATAGVDTLYVADDSALALTKYTLAGGVWGASGTVGVDTDDYRGLAASVNGSTVTLYATRKGGTAAAGGGELVRLEDASGYAGTLTGTPTLLATAAANIAFRGIALAPVSDVLFANGFES